MMNSVRIQPAVLVLTAIAAVAGAMAAPGEADPAPAGHWALQPVRRPPPPSADDSRWIESPVDAFILQRLKSKGLAPSHDADKRTLLRRLTYDLTGLPPTYQEMAAFESDDSPNALARVVDRLLASPAYGERWGRHWLDVARYANTVGDNHGRDNIAPYNYTYRDYVIDAYNRDLPYDRFVLEQIAADRLDLAGEKRPLAALGFITVGRRFLGNIHDTIDDRIDVVTRGLMGLTVQCARCHDHKYEPISMADYYGLYGIFASSTEPAEPPIIAQTDDPAAFQAFLEEKKRRQEAVEKFRRERHRDILAEYRKRSGDYLLTAWEVQAVADPRHKERLVRERGLQPLGVGRWIEALSGVDRQNDPIFAPWFAMTALPAEDFAPGAAAIVAQLSAQADAERRINRSVMQALAPSPPSSLAEAAQRYGQLFNQADAAWQQAVAGGAQALPDPDAEAVRQVLYGDNGPGNLSESLLNRLITGTMQIQLAQLQAQIDLLEASHPGAPHRAPVLEDRPDPRDASIFLRGNAGTPGPTTPRRFLKLLGGDDSRPFTQGSGRLELAQAIVHPDNPLTARVLVNHVWMHHFGAPLVNPPDDFGVRTEPPSHPELLDYLASELVDHGWSIKKLHRRIVLSHVYRLASDGPDERDPENRLLSRMNRRRLEFEPMRDTLLQVAGTLDRASGGKPVKLTEAPYPHRRSIYGFIDRQSVPDLLRVFDFADPDACTARRYNTTVPQQALFFMNSPFIAQVSQAMAQRLAASGITEDSERVRQLYRWAFQREPSERELALGLGFVQAPQASAEPAGSTSATLGPWERYCQVLLQSNELSFVD